MSKEPATMKKTSGGARGLGDLMNKVKAYVRSEPEFSSYRGNQSFLANVWLKSKAVLPELSSIKTLSDDHKRVIREIAERENEAVLAELAKHSAAVPQAPIIPVAAVAPVPAPVVVPAAAAAAPAPSKPVVPPSPPFTPIMTKKQKRRASANRKAAASLATAAPAPAPAPAADVTAAPAPVTPAKTQAQADDEEADISNGETPVAAIAATLDPKKYDFLVLATNTARSTSKIADVNKALQHGNSAMHLRILEDYIEGAMLKPSDSGGLTASDKFAIETDMQELLHSTEDDPDGSILEDRLSKIAREIMRRRARAPPGKMRAFKSRVLSAEEKMAKLAKLHRTL